ncbi:glutathione S-transferase family protein [bacterium]|nr:glutathione S-transferase family protein [bacterium]
MITIYALTAPRPELKGLVRDIRPVWTLEELGLPYRRETMNPLEQEHKQPKYLAINPFGKVPALKDGDFTLFESAAICTYLGDKVGKLIPTAGSRERALYDQWVSYTISTFEPTAVRVIRAELFEEKNETTVRQRQDALDLIEPMAAALNAHFAKRSYLLGEQFTIADIQLASSCRIVGHTEFAARHSNLQAYLQRCYDRPAFARASKNNGLPA